MADGRKWEVAFFTKEVHRYLSCGRGVFVPQATLENVLIDVEVGADRVYHCMVCLRDAGYRNGGYR